VFLDYDIFSFANRNAIVFNKKSTEQANQAIDALLSMLEKLETKKHFRYFKQTF